MTFGDECVVTYISIQKMRRMLIACLPGLSSDKIAAKDGGLQKSGSRIGFVFLF